VYVIYIQVQFAGEDFFFVGFDGVGGLGEYFFFISELDGGVVGDAGLDGVDDFPLFGIDFGPLFDLGAGADDGHVAFEDVEKLGELIHFGFAQETAKGGDAGVVAGIEAAFGGFFENAHGAEFIELKHLATTTDALLAKKYRSRHGQQYQHADDEEQWCEQYDA